MELREKSVRHRYPGLPSSLAEIALNGGQTRLRPATGADAATLMSWLAKRDDCMLWGGPAFRHPFTPTSFVEDMRLASLASYALTDDSSTLLGVGQIYRKLERIHLARLAIRPEVRGTGLGKRLISELIGAGEAMFARYEASVFVYRHNTAALRCYKRTGFVAAPWPDADRALTGCLFMIRNNADMTTDPLSTAGAP